MKRAQLRPDILLVGCGKMGFALLSGWLHSDRIGHVTVIEPNPPEQLAQPLGRTTVLPSTDDLDPSWQPAAVVFAVKPQAIAEIIPQYRAQIEGGAFVLSIAAGTTIGSFTSRLSENAAVVRSMPNTPAAIGRGITVAVANPRVSPAQRELAHGLLEAVGSVAWVEAEELLDAVTAVSGSGPAYVFLLVESLTAAGIAAGLPPALAERLARETVSGSGELIRRSTESAAQLRRNVTSPKGTTEAALGVLMAPDGMEPLMARAVEAAARRSRELAN